MNKSLVFTILFLIIVIGFFGFWNYKNRMFSKETLRLEILGPDTAKMGQEIEYTVKYKNNGNFVLQNPKLIFELPDNSLTEDNKIRFTQDLKDIYPGQENSASFKGRLLGKENDLKVARAWLSYTPKNLTAVFPSDTTFTTKISSADLTLDFDLASKSEKGKDIQYNLNYFSNTDYPLENLSIKIDNIDGFTIKSSDPSSLDLAEWKIPTLNKTQGGRIKITGTITADTGKHLTFTAHLGMWVDGQFINIKDATSDLEVIEPKIFISQQINSSPNYIATPGETLHYQIYFRNIGTTPFNNLFMQVKLDNLAFDLSSVDALGGVLRNSDSSIIFDYKQIPALQNLQPQQEGKIEFNVKLKDSTNLTIKDTVIISEISQEFVTKVNSKIELSQKAYYSNQVNIQNTGPIPPVAGKATTYIISWQVKNYSNDVKNVKVKAVLPQGISLTGQLSPDTEYSKFSFDSVSRELVWSVGDIKADQNTEPLYFQISFTPLDWQKGLPATLIKQATIFAENQFTGTLVQNTSPAVDTNLKDDSQNSNKGIVQ